jgi:hypothetical protein
MVLEWKNIREDLLYSCANLRGILSVYGLEN